ITPTCWLLQLYRKLLLKHVCEQQLPWPRSQTFINIALHRKWTKQTDQGFFFSSGETSCSIWASSSRRPVRCTPYSNSYRLMGIRNQRISILIRADCIQRKL
ncbi:hypothetical protein CLAIMM_08293 isoform 1, partial [Cladophialophora immunda]